jgi:hypothetical protein
MENVARSSWRKTVIKEVGMGDGDHVEPLRKNAEYHQRGSSSKGGCLFRCGRSGHKHRVNGKKYLEDNFADADHYNVDFTQGEPKKRFDGVFGDTLYDDDKKMDPRYTKNSWYAKENDNFGSDMSPWPNNAHHILPVAALRNAFSNEECKLLLKANYNINTGENIIYLPKEEDVGKVMQLLIHLGSHGDYGAKIESLINSKIRPAIKKAADPTNASGHGLLTEKDVGKLRDTINNETANIMKNIFTYAKEASVTVINEYDPAWTNQ